MADTLSNPLATSLAFTLIAPERVLASRSAEMVTLPGSEGMLGILPGHAPLVTALKQGIVTVEGPDIDAGTANTFDQFFISGGFAEVTPLGLTILADDAVPLSEMNPDHLNSDKARLLSDLQQAGSDADRAAINDQIALIDIKLAAHATRKAA